MKSAVVLGILALGLFSQAYAVELQVTNKSKTSIHHLYLSEASSNEWGEDQLGDKGSDTVEPGDSFTLTKVEKDVYDVKLVAEDGTECEIDGVRFKGDKEWVITESMLDHCGS